MKIDIEVRNGQELVNTIDGFEIKDLTLAERGEILDTWLRDRLISPWQVWVKVIKIATDLKDEQIVDYSNLEIAAIGRAIVENCDKKK